LFQLKEMAREKEELVELVRLEAHQVSKQAARASRKKLEEELHQ